MTKVITHEYVPGHGSASIVSLCRRHTKQWHPVTYLGVYYGLHEGICARCEKQEIEGF